MTDKKKFHFTETIRSFKYDWQLSFPGFCILPLRMHLTACIVFCFCVYFPTKYSRFENLFSQSSRACPSAVSYL